MALLFCLSLTAISGEDEKAQTALKAALADAVVRCSSLIHEHQYCQEHGTLGVNAVRTGKVRLRGF